METRDDSFWPNAPLRQTPMLLWGIGNLGRKFAASLIDRIQSKARTPAFFRHFQPEPGKELAREVGLALAPLIEAAKRQGGLSSLEVKLIVATWETDDYPLHEVLPLISQVLNQLLNGNQSITLSLLAPDALASVADIEHSHLNLTKLEVLFGELPFLNAAFLYQTPPLAAEGLDDAGLAFLAELLRRECFDAELGEIIRQTVYPAMVSNRRFNDRKAVYAAIGAQILTYSPAELAEHWTARLTRDVVSSGFNAAETVTEPVAKRCANRAEQWADACLPLFEKCLSEKPNQNSRPAWPQTFADTNALNAFGKGLLQFIEEAKKTEAETNQNTLDQTAVLLEIALGEILDSLPAYLAGGLEYLEAAAGRPAWTGDAKNEKPHVTGIPRVIVRFVAQPLAEAATAYFKTLQESLLAEYGQVQQMPEGSPDAWLASIAKATPADGEAAVNVWKGRFCIACKEKISAYIEDNDFNSGNSERLFNRLWGNFTQLYSELLDTHAENLNQQEQIRQAIKDLRASAPWYVKPVYFFTHYQTEENTLKKQNLP